VRADARVIAAVLWLCGICCTAGGVLYSADGRADSDLGSGWKFERRESGVTVSRRGGNGSSMPAFRGQGSLKVHVLSALAVILDVREVERWAYGVTDARSVRHVDDRTEIVYLYSDTPWPVRDRDMVVRRAVSIIEPGSEFAVSIVCEPAAAPERDGVIRVRDCDSSFRVRKIDAQTTEVIYEMSLDPEGALPHWASSFLARTAPVKTLLAIESRASRNQSRYAAFIRRWANAL
jgi:hypothetical protein